uniref:Phostensin/Taperin PP1-binding domain-containing protein n=1 Tax=Knipowitschia caucasica TaxID=637954 RepID=A0AAV2K0Z9_KNICA
MEPEEQSHIGQSVVEVEKDAALLTSVPANDIAQEVSVAKGSPQLPDSLSAFGEGEEVDTAGGNITESPSPESDKEGENVQDEVSLDELLEDDKQFYEEDLKELTEDLESEESLSPSPPESNSLEEMSRIYNLETVGSRSGLCIRDRAGDSVHLIKVKTLNTQQQAEGIQSLQRRIEGFKLKEQEAQKSQISVLQNVRQSPKRNTSKQETTAEKQDKIFSPQTSPRRVNSPDQSIEINSSILRGQSPENSLKILDLAPTPVSSPCSPSPSPSPSSSPAQSPTPTALFTIKSASGGQVKRGATITITPKKPQAPRPSPTTSPTLTTTTTVTEPTKKKYPTVEEIVVIGGYLNLDKSCLVKNRGTAKKVKVCFSEERLEQLCEYPAESSVWPPSPFPLDLDWDPDLDLRMDSLPKTTRSVGTAMTRGLRAGPCHPLLKKHSV